MSAETILPSESSDSSSNPSTKCEDSDSTESGDSTNTLLDKTVTKDCVENGGDVKHAREWKGKKIVCCNPVGQCIWGVVFIILSVTGFVFTPLDFMLWEKLQMRPGLPPYEWWADPPDEVKMRAYLFNVTNHERFLEGLDDKINVDEIGPIVYLEKLLHSNIKFNENSTMTYTAKRFLIFLPEENTVDFNATLIVPNLAVLGLASYLHNANYLVRQAFRFMVSTHGSKLFVKKTIQEYLWDFRDPVLDTSKNLAPGLVPVNNMGIMARIYADFTDEMTVMIGSQWGHEHFFQIEKFRGNPQLPGYDAKECPDRIFGSTEGVMYQQHLTKSDVLLYWRKTVCKLMPLYFDSEVTLASVPLYRYNLSESVHERVSNETDCYDTHPSLPDGISDASKCYFDFPMTSSYPHFYTGGIPKDHFVTGLKPDRMKHNSYVIVEPLTGTPFHSVARMQSNLRVHDLSGFSDEYDRFSNLIIPLFWCEYNQEDLPSKIKWTIYFTVVILPPLSIGLLSALIILGFYLITKNMFYRELSNDKLKNFLHFKSKNVNTLAKNTIFTYEKEKFLKGAS
ncbi:scavenger receptor class B member 1 [Manduca sexta]|uniref:scavenger receptor class B member 1 n=1 Tax=Manduca sexta TaxID=7130 RepID=UPI00188DD09C|nr:scavenger receptor class B member 1 [Manduca sexta]